MKKTIKKTIKNLKKMSAKKATLPIMENILLEASGQYLVMTVINNDVNRYSEKISVNHNKNFTACIPFKKFEKVVKPKIKTIEKIDEKLIIDNGKCKVTIPCDDASDFPSTDTPEKTEDIKLSLELLNKIACFSMPEKKKGREYNKHILLNGNEAVATDSWRISVITSDELHCKNRCSINAGAVKNLAKIFKKEEIECYRSDNQLIIKNKNKTKKAIVGVNTEPNFPNYHKVLSSVNPNSELTVNTKKMKAQAKTLCNINGDKVKKTKLIVNDGIGKMETKDEADTTAEVQIEQFGKGEMYVAFNAVFLLDYLAACESDTITIENEDKKKPIVITENIDDYHHIHALMPVRIWETHSPAGGA